MEAAAGPEALTASFSAEEQRLIDELRSKYTRGPLEPPPPAPASTQAQAQPPAAAPAAQTASCRLCAECQGTGSVVEAYNHRTLERSCTQCGGQGTVRTNAGSGGSSTHNGDGSMRGSSSTQGSTPCSSSGGAKSTHERLAGWEAELEALKQSLAGATDSRELQLKSALILELERAAASLRARLTQADQLPLTQQLADMSLGSPTAEEAHQHSGSEDTISPKEAFNAESYAAVEAAQDPEIQAAAAEAAAALREHPAMKAVNFDAPRL